MKTTIDSTGRLVIPRSIRDKAGFRPGMTLEVQVHDGVVEITPATLEVDIRRTGRWSVAVPHTVSHPALTQSAVEETIEELRNPRSL